MMAQYVGDRSFGVCYIWGIALCEHARKRGGSAEANKVESRVDRVSNGQNAAKSGT